MEAAHSRPRHRHESREGFVADSATVTLAPTQHGRVPPLAGPSTALLPGDSWYYCTPTGPSPRTSRLYANLVLRPGRGLVGRRRVGAPPPLASHDAASRLPGARSNRCAVLVE